MANAKCRACGALLPVAKSAAGKWVGSITAAGIGTVATRSWWGRLIIAGAGLAAGAVVDELAQPLCGACQLS